MRVLHINSYDKRGGAETVFCITRELSHTQNFSGCVKFDSSTKNVDILFKSWEDDNKIVGAFNYIFSIYNYNLLKKFLKLNLIDVIHLHGFFASISPSILLAIRKAKKKQNLKVVQTLHDFHLVCPNASLYNYTKNDICEKCVGKKNKLFIFTDSCDRRGLTHSIIKGVRSFLAQNILHHIDIVDKFICPSEFMKNKLIQNGIDRNKIVLVMNPIVINEITNIQEKKNIICYFGRFSREKNLIFLINAFTSWKEQTNNNFHLLLIGEGEEEAKLKAHVSESIAKDSISFISYLPFSELITRIKEAKYFSLTSNCFENAPMSIFESLTMNILPIAPNIGGMKESIDSISDCGITYHANNIKSWVDAIRFLEDNYSYRVNKLISIKKDFLSKLGVDNYYKNIYQVYKNL